MRRRTRRPGRRRSGSVVLGYAAAAAAAADEAEEEEDAMDREWSDGMRIFFLKKKKKYLGRWILGDESWVY
jgi:hypothetical protein